MKKMFRNLLLTAISSLCILAFVSCSGGINGDEAKTFINDFFNCISSEDYESAETFLHPERPADLKSYFDEVAEKEGVDFKNGIEVVRYTGFKTAYYDSSVEGSTYELKMKTKVGGETITFRIEIVKNDNGYGIYNLYAS